MQRVSLLEFKAYRHFKLSSTLMSLAILAYLLDKPTTKPYGGTMLGYTLGIAAACIVLILLFYGVRKRLTPRLQKVGEEPKKRRLIRARRDGRRTGFTLQEWLSSHIYWGTSLIVLATLHAGFQFGWNLHTLSYVLMMWVILSGFYGTYAYLQFPRLVTENMGEDTLPGLLAKIDHYDQLAAVSSLQFPDEICDLVAIARQKTRIGGSILEQLSGRQKKCPTAFAVQQLQKMGKGFDGEQLKTFHDLYSIMAHKEAAVIRARRDVMFKARLDLWLYIHAPLSIAFLVALLTHIFAIFFYW